MADYGLELRDSSGRVFVRSGLGFSYFYWGKVTISMGGPNDSNRDIALFNIPVSVPIALFTRGVGSGFNSGSEANLLPYNSNGRWRLKRWDQAFSFNVTDLIVYVFVDARYMPNEKYGVRAWDANGIKIYDTSRPLLQAAGQVLVSGQSGPGPTPSWFGAALPPSSWALAHGGFTYSASAQYSAYWTAIGTYIYGFNVIAMPTYGSPAGSRTKTQLMVIDRAYYDQFANLGNMS